MAFARRQILQQHGATITTFGSQRVNSSRTFIKDKSNGLITPSHNHMIHFNSEIYCTTLLFFAVKVYNEELVLQRTFNLSTTTTPPNTQGGDLTEHSGEIYILAQDVSPAEHRIEVYNPAGVFQRSWIVPLSTLWIEANPNDGEIFTATGSLVTVYDTVGNTIRTWSATSVGNRKPTILNNELYNPQTSASIIVYDKTGVVQRTRTTRGITPELTNDGVSSLYSQTAGSAGFPFATINSFDSLLSHEIEAYTQDSGSVTRLAFGNGRLFGLTGPFTRILVRFIIDDSRQRPIGQDSDRLFN